jgi:hypothetical protein
LKSSLFFVVAVLLAAAPAGAQMTAAHGPSDVGNLGYYVGTWSCMAGNVGQKPMPATATYTMDSGLLREFVTVPAGGMMKYPYTLSIAQLYDAKHHRFVDTGLGNDGGWWVSYAKPWTGQTETWIDHANNDASLGRSVTVRDSHDRFSFTSWDKVAGGKVVFKGSCTRTTSGG